MNQQDALALLIGRAILDLHIARQTIVTLEQRVAELEAAAAPEDPGKDTAD